MSLRIRITLVGLCGVCLVASFGCGAGTAGIFGAASGGGGGSGDVNSAPSVGLVEVFGTQTSPAIIRFTLIDAEFDDVTIAIRYRRKSALGGGFEDCTLVTEAEQVFFCPEPEGNCVPEAEPEDPCPDDDDDGDGVDAVGEGGDTELELATEVLTLKTDSNGEEHFKLWKFEEDGIGPEFVEDDVELSIIIVGGGGVAELPEASPVFDVDLGNDPPVVQPFSIDDGASGTVPVAFSVLDSAEDQVLVNIEYIIVDDPACTAPQLARSEEELCPKPFPVETDADGEEEFFFWDSNFHTAVPDPDCNIENKTRMVKLRVTAREILEQADDEPLTSVPFETDPFLVDNNDAPIAVLSFDAVVGNPDQRRAIPIPYRVIDDDGDEVIPVFQWRRAGESFPDLPSVTEVLAGLDDPEFREEHQIATETPTVYEGIPQQLPSLDPSKQIALPELGTTAQGLITRGVIGRELEIRRASKVPRPVASSWGSTGTALTRPVAALPTDGGTSAFVLDEANPGAWQLRRIDLATGTAETIVPAESGAPDALCFEPGSASALVASSDAGVWSVHRVPLDQGMVIPELVASSSGSDAGEIGGIVSLGTDAALVTVEALSGGDLLLRLDLTTGSSVVLLNELHSPAGIALDPVNPNRVFIAERGADRLLSYRCDSGLLETVFTDPMQARPSLRSPTSVATVAAGSRLIVVVEEAMGFQIRSLELGGPDAGRVAVIHAPVGEDAVTGAGALTVGPQGTRLWALTNDNELAVGGGVEQRRTISAFDVVTKSVTVEPDLVPPTGGRRLWRVAAETAGIRGTPDPGTPGLFVWDSEDVPEGGDVFFRLTPIDSAIGVSAQAIAPKALLAPLQGTTQELGDFSADGDVGSTVWFDADAADMNGDGRLDVVSVASKHDFVSIFLLSRSGTLTDATSVSDPSLTGPRKIVAKDLDADGLVDLIVAGATGIVVFLQDASTSTPLDFLSPALTLSGTAAPRDIAIVDFDDDGLLDIIATDDGASPFTGDEAICVYRQNTPPSFERFEKVQELEDDGAAGLAGGDVDGDGRPDVVVASGTDIVALIRQSSTTEPFQLVTVADGFAAAIDVAVADLDGNGIVDVVAADEGTDPDDVDDAIVILPGSPSGTFGPADPMTGDALANPVSVTPVDLDGDGDLDLLTTHGTGISSAVVTSGRLLGLHQVGPAVFDDEHPLTLAEFFLPEPGAAIAFAPAVADLDGDGGADVVSIADLVGSDPVSARLRAFFHSSPGLFDAPQVIATAGSPVGPMAVSAGDFDGDGALDLVSANQFGNDVALFLQTSTGVFTAAPFAVPPVFSEPLDIAVADLNADGDLDVVTTNAGGLSAMLQTGAAPFVFLDPQVSGAQPTALSVGDLDRDGRLDILSANGFEFPTGAGVSAFLQLATDPVSFLEPTMPLTPLGSRVTAVGDVDGDGLTDVVTESGAGIAVLLQSSDGGFLPGTVLAAGTIDLALADIDEDGEPDIVSASGGSGSVLVFRQVSGGSFDPDAAQVLAPPGIDETFGSPPLPRRVAVGDIDSDGDSDIVSANLSVSFVDPQMPLNDVMIQFTLTVFEQTSPGKYDATDLFVGNIVTLDGFRNATTVSIVDVDGDGEKDILWGDSVGDAILVFYGGHR